MTIAASAAMGGVNPKEQAMARELASNAFSFRYGEKRSRDLLGGWKKEVLPGEGREGKQTHATRWTDPATGLTVERELTVFDDFPAAEWVLRFTNHGSADTPILADMLPLDLQMVSTGEVVFRHSHGSTSAATDFMPLDAPVRPNTEIKLAPMGGRSSSGVLPFFNLQWSGGGVVLAIGWSGQWALRLQRGTAGDLTFQAGQQTTHLTLHPGESIRTPRILLLPWQGDDRFRGNNLLRRLLLAHYVPRADGQVASPPVSANTWFTFRAGNDVTETNQLRAIAALAPLGVEVFWLDAGWFEGGWPSGVGSWVPKKQAFPNRLGPLGEAAHKAGMKFMVWFEPERVHPDSRIGKEHPEFVLRTGAGSGLFNLGDPNARAYLTDLMSSAIKDSHIDIWRCDFNIDPLAFWQKADAPDRVGIAEIRYVEGLYAMWDELLRRHPGLLIDNCASGGRRIDLETCSRSYPLWRSDTQCCGRAVPIWDQVQTAGLSLYVPLHAAGLWGFDPYTHRSVALGGACICPDATAKSFPADAARAAVSEMKQLRRLYLGDYYPLTEIGLDERHWIAWQFDRPDLGEGLAVFFRRPASPYASLDVSLAGLDPEAVYEITFADTGRKARLTGKQLAAWRVTIDKAPASQLITYRRLPAK
jgi:alpha-galactosidase